MSSPKGWLELGLIYNLRLNKGKKVLGSWAREASSGKVIGKSMVNKCCWYDLLCRFVLSLMIRAVRSPSLTGTEAGETFKMEICFINVNIFYKRKTCALSAELFLQLLVLKVL